MNRLCLTAVAALSALLACPVAPAQTASHDSMAAMKHAAGVPSTTLTVTGLDGASRTLTVADLRAMPQTTVTVTNSHSGTQETYAGVPVKTLLALVSPAKLVPVTGDAMKAKVSSRMQVVIARGTDKFRVALTLCDTDTDCRSGQTLVADTLNGKPLMADGAFKLVLTEDKTPGRWVRNLDALTVKTVGE